MMTRRQVVGLGSVSLGVGALVPVGALARWSLGGELPATPPAFPGGTTLEATVGLPHGRGYRRLVQGPARRAVLRTDLAAPATMHAARRTALGVVVQLTDLHLTDVQNPLRFEYLDAHCRSAYRPQELLGVQGATAMVERVNGLRRGPFTGRPIDVVVSTGDAVDNQSGIELGWLLGVFAGGAVRPSSGDPSRFEGVASCGVGQYWQPEGDGTDGYSRWGFPRVPGLLAAATAPLSSPGLDVPWLLTMGNHDNAALGTLPDQPELVDWCLGDRKIVAARTEDAHLLGDRLEALTLADAPRIDGGAGALLAGIARNNVTIAVTPDERRRPLTTEQYVEAVRDPRHTGAGPVGHGYGDDAGDGARLYFSHRVSDELVVLSLDTTNQAGGASGSVGTAQLRWLEEQLTRHASDYVVVVSHHPSHSMDNLAPDPRDPDEDRHSGEEVLALLHDHPQVVAWVNGHAHRNRITPRRHRDPRASFWEISTASHVDAPQQARVLEVARNGDGTLSVFTTLIDAASPVQTSYDDLSPSGLASLYRELAFNDLQLRERAGSVGDGNTELLLVDPQG